VFIAVLVLPAPALGQGSGELSSDPSVNQYVESVPTTKGSKPTTRRPDDKPAPLPPEVRRKLEAEGGPVAEELEEIATSPALGAPATPRDGKPGSARERGGHDAPARDERGTVSAVAQAVGGDGAGAMGTLLGGLLLISGVVAAAALHRRRTTTG
jgi:hypothetical protein